MNQNNLSIHLASEKYSNHSKSNKNIKDEFLTPLHDFKVKKSLKNSEKMRLSSQGYFYNFVYFPLYSFNIRFIYPHLTQDFQHSVTCIQSLEKPLEFHLNFQTFLKY